MDAQLSSVIIVLSDVHCCLGMSSTSGCMLERLIGQIRENIGVEPACGSSVSTMSSSLSGSDVDEPPSPFESRSRGSSETSSLPSTPSNLSSFKSGFLKKGISILILFL